MSGLVGITGRRVKAPWVTAHVSALAIAIVAVILPGSSASSAQESHSPTIASESRVEAEKLPEATFRVQTKLTLSTFEFHPARHHRLADLRAEDITVLDNGIPQKVIVFEGARTVHGKVPTDVILLFDCSAQFRHIIDPGVLGPHVLDELENVRITIYGFSDSTYRLIKPTADSVELNKAMKRLIDLPGVAPKAINPIIQTMDDAVSIPGSRPRIMLIFSGGNGRACKMPRDNYKQTVARAIAYHIALFPVAIQPQQGAVDASVSGRKAIRTPVPSSPGIGAVQRFLDIGKATGGEGIFRYATPMSIISEAIGQVASQSESEYTVGFYPDLNKQGTHQIKVVLKRRDVGKLTGGGRTVVY
jgi:VWFA-related protein